MMRHPMLALVGALVLALVGPSVAAQEATPTSSASVLVGAITDMRYLLPFTPDGLNPRLHATATEDGYLRRSLRPGPGPPRCLELRRGQ